MTAIARSMNDRLYDFLYLTELRPSMKSRRGWRRVLLSLQRVLSGR
jgi:hypothetical protein